MEITTQKRPSGDWYAFLTNRTGIWGCGRTESEAIGDLVKTAATFDKRVKIHSMPFQLGERD